MGNRHCAAHHCQTRPLPVPHTLTVQGMVVRISIRLSEQALGSDR